MNCLCLVSGRGGGCEAEQEHGRDDAVGESALGGQDLSQSFGDAAVADERGRGEVEGHHDCGEHGEQPQVHAVKENDADQPSHDKREREGDQDEPEGEPRLAAQHTTRHFGCVGEQQDRLRR